MPVWHAETKALRAAGELEVCGIVQEQHRERAELYAQWQGLDWPILWDPFNVTGAEVVLNAYLVRPDGVIWKARAKPDDLETFLALEWPAHDPVVELELSEPGLLSLDGRTTSLYVSPANPNTTDAEREARELAGVLWSGGDSRTQLRAHMLRSIQQGGSSAEQSFRLGVTSRILWDLGQLDWSKWWPTESGERVDTDAEMRRFFDEASASWATALAARPSQYIWRRRLQQYGPQLDKPYPFYDWVETARAEIRARGEEPVALRVALTATETLGRKAVEASAATEPDPEAKLPADEGWFAVDATFVHDTQGRDRACAHLSFAPLVSKDAHWNDEAGPLVVWIEGAEGVVDARRLEVAPGGDENRRKSVSFDLTPKAGATLAGYAVLEVCENDVCRTVRHDFSFEVPTK